MDHVECPECKTRYTFERLGIHPPNDVHSTLATVIKCKVCDVVFESKVRWRPIKVRQAVRMIDRLLRRQLPPRYDYAIEAVSTIIKGS